MSDAPARHPITLKRLIRHIDGMERLPVRRDVPYHESAAGPHLLDVYHPAASGDGRRPPAVILAAGYRDVGVPLPLGCRFKEMEMVVSLAQLLAASGLAAVAYSTGDPAADAGRVADHLAGHAASLGLDGDRIGVWASSGNVPVALALLMQRREAVRAAVLSSGYTLDDGGGTAVADAARDYRFANASAGRGVEDLPAAVPLFLVRCGRDEFAGLNDALDRFAAGAIARNLPLTLVNHAAAPHAFELSDDTAASRHLLDAMLAFLRVHLAA